MKQFLALTALAAGLALAGCIPSNSARTAGPHNGVDMTTPSDGVVPGQTSD